MTPLAIFIIPSGKRLHNYRKSPFLMGKSDKSTISMAIFNSFLYVYQAGYLAEFFASFHGLSNGMPPISWDMTPKNIGWVGAVGPKHWQ